MGNAIKAAVCLRDKTKAVKLSEFSNMCLSDIETTPTIHSGFFFSSARNHFNDFKHFVACGGENNENTKRVYCIHWLYFIFLSFSLLSLFHFSPSSLFHSHFLELCQFQIETLLCTLKNSNTKQNIKCLQWHFFPHHLSLDLHFEMCTSKVWRWKTLA